MSRSRMKSKAMGMCLIWFLLFSILFLHPTMEDALAQAEDPTPPGEPVKLIFIHHSTGENWLLDDYGNLGLKLGQNNYFVSDTNYGWGPDAIGDRTDIPNWLEWFRSPQTDRYMAELFTESRQNSWYTRTLSDPGGENEVIMFKSCFPNSDLEGNPDDPPTPGQDFTVGNAKYVYNELLKFFITRPDKLFVVITAPPLQDRSNAGNARAFNTWLMQNWLIENNYPYNNVAVFDFYNILTHPDNHHRFKDGQIEYIASHGNNTLYYDSDGDDHANPVGSQKATDEFIPLLNIFYHRWKTGQTENPPVPATPVPSASGEEQPAVGGAVPVSGNVIDDFEGGTPSGSEGWQAYFDEGSSTTNSCTLDTDKVHNGNAALQMNYSVAADSWATCALTYYEPVNWSSWEGISFYIQAKEAGLSFDLITYGGEANALTTYIYTVETTESMLSDWVLIEVPWGAFLRADWEENAGTPFDPTRSLGIAFGLVDTGELWVDDIQLSGEAAPPAPALVQEPPAQPPAPPSSLEATPVPEEKSRGLGGLCPNSLIMGGLVLMGFFWMKRRQ